MSGHIDFEEWAKRFTKFLKRNITASRSWMQLKQADFSDEVIAAGFYLACDFPDSPGYEAFAELREDGRRKAQRTRKLIARLEEDRDEICSLLGDRALSRDSMKLTTPVDTHASSKRLAAIISLSLRDTNGGISESVKFNIRDGFDEKMLKDFEARLPKPTVGDEEQASSEIDTMRPRDSVDESEGETVLDQIFSNLRRFEKENRKLASKHVNGPTFFLALGLTLIKKNTGKAYYRQYADLINVANAAFGNEAPPIGEEAVRKVFQRFIKRHPDFLAIDSYSVMLIAALYVLIHMNRSSDQ